MAKGWRSREHCRRRNTSMPLPSTGSSTVHPRAKRLARHPGTEYALCREPIGDVTETE